MWPFSNTATTYRLCRLLAAFGTICGRNRRRGCAAAKAAASVPLERLFGGAQQTPGGTRVRDRRGSLHHPALTTRPAQPAQRHGNALVLCSGADCCTGCRRPRLHARRKHGVDDVRCTFGFGGHRSNRQPASRRSDEVSPKVTTRVRSGRARRGPPPAASAHCARRNWVERNVNDDPICGWPGQMAGAG